jgi:hypothetical protein
MSPPASPVAAVERAGLGLGLVHALVATAILIVAAGARLARPSPERAPSRRAFVEHVQAVGALYRRGGHASHALAAFARFADHRLRARIGRGGGDIPAFLASRSELPLDLCQRLWSRAMRAKDGDAPEDALQVLKELSAVYSLATEREQVT